MHGRFILVLLLLMTVGLPVSAATIGKKMEALGIIAGFYYANLRAIEVCGAYPALKQEAEVTSRQYLSNNQDLFGQIKRALALDIERDKGKKAVVKFELDLANGLVEIQKSGEPHVRSVTGTESDCKAVLATIRHGYWDIKNNNLSEVGLIYNNGSGKDRNSSNVVGFDSDQRKNYTGFRGIPWGVGKDYVRKYLSDMSFKEEVLQPALCRLFRGEGVECGAYLIAENYTIDDNVFSVRMYFTAFDQLAEVEVFLNGLPTAKSGADWSERASIQNAVLSSYHRVLKMLEAKYGKVQKPSHLVESMLPSCNIFSIKDELNNGGLVISIRASADQCGSYSSVNITYKPVRQQKEKSSAKLDRL